MIPEKVNRYIYIYNINVNIFCMISSYIYIFTYRINIYIYKRHFERNSYPVLAQLYIRKDGTSVPKRLTNAYDSFRQWCRDNHHTPFVKHFTKENLGWASMRKFPECSFKGSDTRLLLGWLIHFVENQGAGLDEIATSAFVAAMAIDNFFTLLVRKQRQPRLQKSVAHKR